MYGFADIIVLVVGGFLLIPLYTRVLSKEEFGHYIAIRANIDLITYTLQLGVPSAVARLYAEHLKFQTQRSYIVSVLWIFTVNFLVIVIVLLGYGVELWSYLSPHVPIFPALPLSLTVAALGFLSTISVICLRSEGKVLDVVLLQIGSTVLLVSGAVSALLLLDMRLSGILAALIISSILPASWLVFWLYPQSKWFPRFSDVSRTLKFSFPVLIGYYSHFTLNRLSTIILQREVSYEEIGIYGLAQQMSMVISMVCTSFGMALQPIVYSGQKSTLEQSLIGAWKLLFCIALFVVVGLLTFARELYSIFAPSMYAESIAPLAILAVGQFTQAATLISESALMYHNKVKTSTIVTIMSAIVTAILGLWLIPKYHINGGAIAVTGGMVVRMLISQGVAAWFTGITIWKTAILGLSTVAIFGLLTLQNYTVPIAESNLTVVKILGISIFGTAMIVIYQSIKRR